jgi:hypothetical protein
MPQSVRMAILLTTVASQEQVAVIELDPSGMLVFRVIRKGLHVFALKPLERLLRQHVFPEPLYVKHAQVLREQSRLPLAILEQEARACADVLNRLEQPLSMAGQPVKAEVVQYTS